MPDPATDLSLAESLAASAGAEGTGAGITALGGDAAAAAGATTTAGAADAAFGPSGVSLGAGADAGVAATNAAAPALDTAATATNAQGALLAPDAVAPGADIGGLAGGVPPATAVDATGASTGLASTTPSVSSLPASASSAGDPLGGTADAMAGSPAPATATDAAPGFGQPIPPTQETSFLQKGLDQISKNPLTAASLGINALNQASANKKIGNAQQQIQQTVQPLQATQQGLISQYNSGTLTAADAQSVADFVAQSKAQIQQQYASAGLGGSSQMVQAMAAIDQKAAAMQDQMLKNYLSSALQTTGAITGPYAGLAQQQIAQDTALQAAAGNVMRAAGTNIASNAGAPAATGA